MPNQALSALLTDSCFPSRDRPHSGGVEVACDNGTIADAPALRAFLRGRLWTAGRLAAFAAAAVCVRAMQPPVHRSLWWVAEAELDARIPSPAARNASRHQGGELLRQALRFSADPALDSLARASVPHYQNTHHAVTLGAVGAAAGMEVAEAASFAAYASIAAPASAAREILGLDPEEVARIGVELAPEVERVAHDAAAHALDPLSHLPCVLAPALEYLAEEHAGQPARSYAS
jgi:urease accessory protein